jgi:type I restriction enzyme M protein
MTYQSNRLVQKLWSFCQVLRDDGLSYHRRKATWSEKNPEGRWRAYTYAELLQRDKVSLDLFWLRDESLEDSASLPDPHILAAEIADDLRAALEQIEDVLGDLQARAESPAGD